jgi:hypothetical protein
VFIRNRTSSALGYVTFAALVAVSLGACSDDEPERDETTNEITEAGDADVFTMAVGDCLPDQSAALGEVADVPVVPCEQPHASEVFYSHIIDGEVMPDPPAMEAIVTEQCTGGNFESFVGLSYDQSVLEVSWLEPTIESWGSGDREILCIVNDPAGGVTGSLAGAAR